MGPRGGSEPPAPGPAGSSAPHATAACTHSRTPCHSFGAGTQSECPWNQRCSPKYRHTHSQGRGSSEHCPHSPSTCEGKTLYSARTCQALWRPPHVARHLLNIAGTAADLCPVSGSWRMQSAGMGYRTGGRRVPESPPPAPSSKPHTPHLNLHVDSGKILRLTHIIGTQSCDHSTSFYSVALRSIPEYRDAYNAPKTWLSYTTGSCTVHTHTTRSKTHHGLM